MPYRRPTPTMTMQPPATSQTKRTIDEAAVTAFARGALCDEMRVELRGMCLSTKGVKQDLTRRPMEARQSLHRDRG